jgi:hypothetical protein
MYTPAFISKQGSFDSDINGQLNLNFLLATLSMGLGAPSAIAASGAVNPNVSGCYVITKSTALAALTLAAPIAGAPQFNAQGVNVGGNDGTILFFTSNSAYAHTVTATGLYQDGAGDVNLATFAAHAGASFAIWAYNGKWNTLFLQNVTMS